AVVTGGTVGIGFEVAKVLALAGARVLLISRNHENAEEAISKIKSEADQHGSTVDVIFTPCDLGSLEHVRQVGDRIREEEDRLDLLILDAGVGVNKYDVSADGIDRHFAVNHLGHFYLTNRVLPLMRRTADLPGARAPRIVAVSSELHRALATTVKFSSLDEINTDLGAEGLYARSKLANILFIKYGLVERVLRPTRSRIIAIATHPGAVHTTQQDQFKDTFGTVVGTMMKHLTIPFMRNPEQGSLSTLWAATSEEVDEDPAKWNGHYITDPGQLSEESRSAQSPELGKNLWGLSELIVRRQLGPDALLPWDENSQKN
ncbi:NAD(P)-binding protein, partial [Daedalea quercina L-15889]